MQYTEQLTRERISISAEEFEDIFNSQPKGVEYFLNTIKPFATGRFLLFVDQSLNESCIDISVRNGKLHCLTDAAIKYFEDGTIDLRFCIDGEEYFNQVTDDVGERLHVDEICTILENCVVLDEYQGPFDIKWYKLLKKNEIQTLPYFKQFIFETKAEQVMFKTFLEKVRGLYQKGNPCYKVKQFLEIKEKVYPNIEEASIDLATNIAKFITKYEQGSFERYETISKMLF